MNSDSEDATETNGDAVSLLRTCGEWLVLLAGFCIGGISGIAFTFIAVYGWLFGFGDTTEKELSLVHGGEGVGEGALIFFYAVPLSPVFAALGGAIGVMAARLLLRFAIWLNARMR